MRTSRTRRGGRLARKKGPPACMPRHAYGTHHGMKERNHEMSSGAAKFFTSRRGDLSQQVVVVS
eukprot:6458046-Pyramimonas_sp.AAC.1